MIPLSHTPVSHPSNPYRMEQSELSVGNNFFNWIAARTTLHEVRDYHKSEAEKYAEQWQIRRAA